MKKALTKAVALVFALLTLFMLASCGETAPVQRDTKTKIENGETLKIGIVQYMKHASLDNCYRGVREALDNSGIKMDIDYQVGGNSADADCTGFCKRMVASDYDMIIAIATPAAKAAFAATQDTDIPVVFCAVSDPVSTGLVTSMDKPGAPCSGTSDILNMDAQVALIHAMQPDAKKIGVVYTTTEENSLAQLENLRKAAEKVGMEVVAKSIQNGSEVASAVSVLVTEVDCINNFTDNNVVNNLSTLVDIATANKIPVYGSEIEQVKRGCLAAVSIEYVALGRETGNMAVSALKGQMLADTPVKTISDALPVINSDVLTALGITCPDAYKNAETVTTEN